MREKIVIKWLYKYHLSKKLTNVNCKMPINDKYHIA